MSGFTADDVTDQSGRTFLVTGANTGLGFEAAKVLAARGGRVLLGCRSEDKATEAMAHSYAHLYDLPITMFRFFTVYGPWGRPDMALFKFTDKILKGEPIDVFNHGNHRRDFTYIDDIVEGVVRVMGKTPEGNPDWTGDNPDPASSKAPWKLYNIGNNQPVELMRYIEVIEECLGKKAEKNMLPLQPGDVPDTYADVDALVDDVGYKPNTTIEDGIKRFVDWYREFYGV